MKKYLLPFMLLLLSACERESTLPEATTAAKEVYQQYAGRKDLTVALIGDYQGYNAVMLQAQDNEGWLHLCEEFGVRKEVDADALDTSRVSSLTIASINTRDYNSLEDFKSHSDSSIRELVSHIADDIVKEAVAQIVDSLTGLNPISGSRPFSIHIDTCYSVTKRMHYDNDVLVDSSGISDTAIPTWNRQLMKTATQKGHNGYIIHDDSDELTLWLFFYSTPAEKEQILDHITSTNAQK